MLEVVATLLEAVATLLELVATLIKVVATFIKVLATFIKVLATLIKVLATLIKVASTEGIYFVLDLLKSCAFLVRVGPNRAVWLEDPNAGGVFLHVLLTLSPF